MSVTSRSHSRFQSSRGYGVPCNDGVAPQRPCSACAVRGWTPLPEWAFRCFEIVGLANAVRHTAATPTRNIAVPRASVWIQISCAVTSTLPSAQQIEVKNTTGIFTLFYLRFSVDQSLPKIAVPVRSLGPGRHAEGGSGGQDVGARERRRQGPDRKHRSGSHCISCHCGRWCRFE